MIIRRQVRIFNVPLDFQQCVDFTLRKHGVVTGDVANEIKRQANAEFVLNKREDLAQLEEATFDFVYSNKTKVSFISYVLDPSKLNKGAGSNLEKVEKEDEIVVENVQKGVRSSFYKAGRFSPKREKGVHHFHVLLSKFINQ